MLRRMLIEMIRSDPAYNNGDYSEQPPSFKLAATVFSMATSGGTQVLYRAAPTRAQADKLVEARLEQRFTADANNYIYSYDAARDYDPSPGLEKIKARVLAINAADDKRNPIELGILEREIKRISNARYYQIPASAETRGHGTSGEARWWKHLLPDLLNEASTPDR
jgi:homoserine O-acetyltransferase